jgi:hypothetical protein
MPPAHVRKSDIRKNLLRFETILCFVRAARRLITSTGCAPDQAQRLKMMLSADRAASSAQFAKHGVDVHLSAMREGETSCLPTSAIEVLRLTNHPCFCINTYFYTSQQFSPIFFD